MSRESRPEILALIPARGGSKSIPRKNLLMIAGKPLIAHSIEQALASQHITRTIVSTDDPEIAAVARKFGSDVPFLRPTEFAQDLSPDIDAFRHALEWLRDHEGYECELVIHLRPTGPVRRVELIDQAIELITQRPEVDSLRSVSWPSQTPYKMWKIADGLLQPVLEIEGVVEPYCLPRQALPEVYWQNGYVDITRPRVVLEQEMMHGDRIIPFFIDEPMLEIDYEDSIAEVETALLRLRDEVKAASGIKKRRHPV
jgi:CMP-N,N'-diacetyllegionaminic acid synthase